MIYEINANVVYVKGYSRGAIYDFETEKVYSIDREGCDIIENYINKKEPIEDLDYIALLKNNNLISEQFEPRKYVVATRKDIQFKFVWLEITSACNMKCIHCYEGLTHAKLDNSLTLMEWKRIIDELKEVGVKNVIVIGGEPTCHPKVNDILKYIHKKNMRATLFTNAINMSNELIDIVEKTNSEVKVSVYGHTSQIHDSITQINGSFEKMVANVKKLINRNIKVISSIIIMRENEQYIDNIIDFTKGLGMIFNKYDVIRSVYGGIQSNHIPILQSTKDYELLKKPNFSITKQKFDNATNRNTCWYGKFAIQEDGKVIPCVFERNISYGNIREKTIQEILDSKELKDNWFLDFSKIETCKDCEYRFACKDCRPLGISVCNSLYSKNPRCLYNPYKGEWSKC